MSSRIRVRDVLEACRSRSGENADREFLVWFRRGLGLCDERGVRHYDAERGRHVLESAGRRFRPSDFSILELGQSLTGLHGGDLEEALSRRRQTDVLESGLGINPSQLPNTSLFNAAVYGLLEAQVLEAYDRPDYIGDQLAKTIPTKKRREKMIGVVESADSDAVRKPGERHPRATISDRVQETPDTINRALAIEVYVETVMFDETGLVLQTAEKVAERLRLRKELAILDMVLGLTNNYNYGGTTYNTYLTAGSWVNVVGSNPLVDWRDVDEAAQLFASMVDPENREPIMISAKQILVMPQNVLAASAALNATQYWSQRGSGDGQSTQILNNPIAGGGYSLLSTSPWLYSRARNGLGLNEANAKGLWFLGDFQKAFAYMENFPLTITRATPNDYESADRRITAALFLDEMGIPAVRDPRYVVKCKVEA